MMNDIFGLWSQKCVAQRTDSEICYCVSVAFLQSDPLLTLWLSHWSPHFLHWPLHNALIHIRKSVMICPFAATHWVFNTAIGWQEDGEMTKRDCFWKRLQQWSCLHEISPALYIVLVLVLLTVISPLPFDWSCPMDEVSIPQVRCLEKITGMIFQQISTPHTSKNLKTQAGRAKTSFRTSPRQWNHQNNKKIHQHDLSTKILMQS